MHELLRVSALQKTYGSGPQAHTALSGLDFSVRKSDFVAVMGPSGSGKTTLLNILAGIDTPTSGEVRIANQNFHDLSGEALAHFRRTQLGFVFQDFNLLDTLTIGENIVLPMLLEGKPPTDRLRVVLQNLGIADLEKRFPYQVSGGQQQRAAIARAIIHQPALVLADEPSGNLDSQAATSLLGTFSSLNQHQAITFVMVTHDPRAASYAKRIIFIKDGQLYKELHRTAADGKGFYDNILSVLGELESVVHE